MTHICNRPGWNLSSLIFSSTKEKNKLRTVTLLLVRPRSQQVVGIEPKTLTSRLLSFPCRPFRGTHWRVSRGLLSLCTKAIQVCQSEGTPAGVVPAVQGTGLRSFVGGRQVRHKKQRWRKPHCLLSVAGSWQSADLYKLQRRYLSVIHTLRLLETGKCWLLLCPTLALPWRVAITAVDLVQSCSRNCVNAK